MILHKLDRYRDAGLLVLRIGIGVMFMLHGFPKVMGGPEG
jgi:putative oxidoreductase